MTLSKVKLKNELLWMVLSVLFSFVLTLLIGFVYGSPIEISNHDTYFVISSLSVFLLSVVFCSFCVNLCRFNNVRFKSVYFNVIFLLQIVLICFLVYSFLRIKLF